MPSILVFGHKNPDNDAISAAIGYAYLKNELAKKNGEDVTYEAVRLGGLPPDRVDSFREWHRDPAPHRGCGRRR